MLHPWKCPRQVGWGLEQPHLMSGTFVQAGGWNKMILKIPSNPRDSTIL